MLVAGRGGSHSVVYCRLCAALEHNEIHCRFSCSMLSCGENIAGFLLPYAAQDRNYTPTLVTFNAGTRVCPSPTMLWKGQTDTIYSRVYLHCPFPGQRLKHLISIIAKGRWMENDPFGIGSRRELGWCDMHSYLIVRMSCGLPTVYCSRWCPIESANIYIISLDTKLGTVSRIFSWKSVQTGR